MFRKVGKVGKVSKVNSDAGFNLLIVLNFIITICVLINQLCKFIGVNFFSIQIVQMDFVISRYNKPW